MGIEIQAMGVPFATATLGGIEVGDIVNAETLALQGVFEAMGDGLATRADMLQQAARFASDLPAFLVAHSKAAPVPAVQELTAGVFASKSVGKNKVEASQSLVPTGGHNTISNTPKLFNISITGTPIENVDGFRPEDIEHIQKMLYSGLIAQFPILRNIPLSKLTQLVSFEVNIQSFYVGGENPRRGFTAFLIVFFGESKIGFCSEQRAQLVQRLSWDTGKPIGDKFIESVRVLSLAGYEKSEAPQSISIEEENLRFLVMLLAKDLDLSENFSSDRLQAMLSLEYPELEIYFHLDRLLKLAVSNPEALKEHLHKEITAAESKIRDLLQAKEIDEQTANARLEALRQELADVGSRVEIARRELTAAASARDEFQREKDQLEQSAEKLRELVRELFFGDISGRFEAAPEIRNIELIQLKNKTEEAELRRKISSLIRGALTGELLALVQLKGEPWQQKGVGIQLHAEITGYDRKKSSGLFNRQEAHLLHIALFAQMETASYRKDLSVVTSLELRDEEPFNDQSAFFAEVVSSFISEATAHVESLIVEETLSPRRPALAQLLAERSRAIGSGTSDANSFQMALDDLLEEARRHKVRR